MRPIIFRGKALLEPHKGQWAYGYLCDNIAPYITNYNEEDDCEDICMVDPDTIGQFTGLTDKNGTEIYEGDVVRYYDEIEDELVSNPVVYNADFCAFCIDDKSKDPTGLFAHWEYEVIGNIHDKKNEQ